MKKPLFVFFVLMLPLFASAQYKISLSKANVFKFEGDYLIDATIKNGTKSLLLIDDQTLIPDIVSKAIKALTYGTLNKISIIQPNTPPIKREGKNHLQNVIYLITVGNRSLKIDTTFSGEIDTLINKYVDIPVEEAALSNDFAKVYYREGYGSVCCPRDSIWEIADSLSKYDHAFSEKYHTNTGKVYSLLKGREGEHVVFYSLSNLSGQQKIEYIHNKTNLIYDKLYHTKNPPSLCFPYIESIPGTLKR